MVAEDFSYLLEKVPGAMFHLGVRAKSWQTPRPIWMEKDDLPEWAERRKQEWIEFAHSNDKLTHDKDRRREEMVKALATEDSAS